LSFTIFFSRLMLQYLALSEIWMNWSMSKISCGMFFAFLFHECVSGTFICCGGFEKILTLYTGGRGRLDSARQRGHSRRV